ncbi:MAG TPA: hypothetical protein PLZ08_02365 [Bacillota bacterium]|mgnify:CR=1 FL=1|jgi:hypothetical protein|nr:hypothetical protein [Bacillota bacterium]HOL09916.1 hypothetical protein [Bacillota bacterium]HPO96783.1 hypothetical protein [Bacillota bacterium]
MKKVLYFSLIALLIVSVTLSGCGGGGGKGKGGNDGSVTVRYVFEKS